MTVIVLVILASVTLRITFKDKGIINQAEKSTELYSNAEEYDKQATDKVSQDLANALKELEEEEALEKRVVDMFDDGELKIGDYVNYKNPTSGEYTALGTKTGMQDAKNRGETVQNDDLNQVYKVASNQLNWRVLGKDKATGGLKLIAGSPMKKESTSNNPYLRMYMAQAYTTGYKELDAICAMYKNDLAISARSVNVDDINELTGMTTDAKIQALDSKYLTTYTFSNHWTPEAWLTNKNEPLSTISGTVDGYTYSVTKSQSAGSAVMTDTRAYQMLFDNTNANTTKGRPYWIASRGVRIDALRAYFGPGVLSNSKVVNGYDAFLSDLAELGAGTVSNAPEGFAVRPVVILKSSVAAKDLQKIADKTESMWSYGSSTGGGDS